MSAGITVLSYCLQFHHWIKSITTLSYSCASTYTYQACNDRTEIFLQNIHWRNILYFNPYTYKHLTLYLIHSSYLSASGQCVTDTSTIHLKDPSNRSSELIVQLKSFLPLHNWSQLSEAFLLRLWCIFNSSIWLWKSALVA